MPCKAWWIVPRPVKGVNSCAVSFAVLLFQFIYDVMIVHAGEVSLPVLMSPIPFEV